MLAQGNALAEGIVTCRECGRKVVPKGRDVCDRKECRDSFARGLKQWHRMYGIGKKDLPAALGVKKYLGNPKHIYKSK